MSSLEDLHKLVDSTDPLSLPEEIVAERERGWLALFTKFDQTFSGDKEFTLDNLETIDSTKELVEPLNYLKRSRVYKEYIAAQNDFALEVATQHGNLDLVSDEEDIGDEEESEDSSEEDFLKRGEYSRDDTGNTLLSSPIPHKVGSPAAYYKRKKYSLETEESQKSISSFRETSQGSEVFDHLVNSTPVRQGDEVQSSPLRSPPVCRTPLKQHTASPQVRRKFTLSAEKRPVRSSEQPVFQAGHRLAMNTESFRDRPFLEFWDKESSENLLTFTPAQALPLCSSQQDTNLIPVESSNTVAGTHITTADTNIATADTNTATADTYNASADTNTSDANSATSDTGSTTAYAKFALDSKPNDSSTEEFAIETLICTKCRVKTDFPVDLEFPEEIEDGLENFRCDECLLESRHKECECEICTATVMKTTWRYILLDMYNESIT